MVHQSTHENYSRSEIEGPGSERAFGMVMAAVMILLATINFWHHKHVWPWLGAIALCFALGGLLAPDLLKPLNRMWHRIGMLLHSIVNPIVMGVLFYLAIWPIGVVFRLRRKDLLRLKRQPESNSYWLIRQSRGPTPESMKDQF